nr:immunoglobulin light chain junction region [Macaca mulatta]MOY15910.1 immunoglobulin light chain junction region [Macaca mulatta]MOY16091.1 immunoglobulin light chain junction region [Macaca mulatta]MOY16151.1 immunoglobulin light chain junction region [Macaca mulatta]MOY16228.1 immunoglobulin light chain junction region [Macaca mulatta]
DYYCMIEHGRIWVF